MEFKNAKIENQNYTPLQQRSEPTAYHSIGHKLARIRLAPLKAPRMTHYYSAKCL